MKYTKPQVALTESALRTIQGVPKPYGSAIDGVDGSKTATSNAYEADE